MVARPLQARKVLILVQNLPVPFDRRVWQEALALTSAGASVTVVCPSSPRYPAGRIKIEGIEVRRYRAPREASGVLGYLLEYGWALFAMTLAAPSRKFDVVHFCNPPDLLFLVALPFKLFRGSKLIFDQHDLGPELVRAKHLPMGKVLVAVARLWEHLTFIAADHVISTNQSYREIALSRGSKREHQVTIVRSGPSAAWTEKVQLSDRWRNGRKYSIGYVGVMGRQEGLEYLLEAMRIIVFENGMDAQLNLVGSGPDVARLKDIVVALNLSPHVAFLGRLPDDDLRSVLANSDVCVNPDEFNELNNKSTMNKIVEYMALGRPIVQFDVKEGRYSAASASLYAAPNDAGALAEAIQRILANPTLGKEMGNLGKLRFEESLSWESQEPKLVRAYRTVLNEV